MRVIDGSKGRGARGEYALPPLSAGRRPRSRSATGWFAGLLLSTLLPPTLPAAPVAEVNVNVDLTAAGRKLTRPTPATPVYYVPVIGGLHEEGDIPAGGPKPPPQNFVLHQMAVALASQGYVVANSRTPPPTLLLVFHWGRMSPNVDDVGDADNPMQAFPNEKRMLALVAGNTTPNLNPFTERLEVMRDIQVSRYFAMVSAYDYAAAKGKKKVALWRAKMSMPADGSDLTDAIPALLSAGAPFLGKETVAPERVTRPLGRQGSVKLGEAQFEEFPDTKSEPRNR